MPAKRKKRLHVLLSSQEWNMLLALADEYGLTSSSVVRTLIRRAESRFPREGGEPVQAEDAFPFGPTP